MKRIIFDFDGTLLDSSRRHVAVLQECLDAHHIRYDSLDDYLAFKADGKPTLQYLTERFGMENAAAKDIASAWVGRIEERAVLVTDKLYDDALPALNACKNAGHTLYLLSARKSEANLRDQVTALGISSYFQEVFCVSPKDAADHKTAIAKKIQAEVIVGDTEVDWSAAEQLGIAYSILNRGFRSKYYWDKRGVTSFDDLLTAIEIII